MKFYMADKPVKAGAIQRVLSSDGVRCDRFEVDDGAGSFRVVDVSDGPLIVDPGFGIGDVLIDHGSHVTFMTADAFAEAYDEVPA